MTTITKSTLINKLENWMRPAETKLMEKLSENKYYPFHPCSPVTQSATSIKEDRIFQLSVRYSNLYFAVISMIVSVLLIIIWSFNDNVSVNNLFLFPLISLIVSLITIYKYRSNTQYMLNLDTLTYTFSQNNKVITKGHFHNIYIRLKREPRAASRELKYYYLIFNGFQIDQRRISGSSTNVDELRRLGQQIAGHLNLNYFDEANSSEFHLIRHLRPNTSSFK